jgi:hypothetical protein
VCVLFAEQCQKTSRANVYQLNICEALAKVGPLERRN